MVKVQSSKVVFCLLAVSFFPNKFTGYDRPLAAVDKDTFEVRNRRECHNEVPYTARDKNHLYQSDGVHGFRIIK
jgi:hypothetical protein